MKFRSLFILLISVTLILAPAAGLRFSSNAEEGEPSSSEPTTTSATKTTEKSAQEPTVAIPTTTENSGGYKVKLLRRDSGKVEDIPLEEYVVGALAAEMPASWHAEALKAQATACRTFAVYSRGRAGTSLNGADMSDFAGSHQGYLDEGQRKAKWGESFDKNEKLCRDAVKSTAGKILRYKDNVAFTAFHAISSGVTESAKNVWGNDLAYLRPVNSAGDALSPNYALSVAVPLSEFHEKLGVLDCKITDGKISIGKITLTESGYVEQIVLGGKEIRGIKLREVFALPSAAFTLTVTDGGAVFECRGLGHGVGMSQFGAQTMAQQGSSWQDILGHYYGGQLTLGDV